MNGAEHTESFPIKDDEGGISKIYKFDSEFYQL